MKKEIKAIIFDIGGVLQLGKYSSKPIRGHRELGVHNFIIKKLKISLDQYFDSLDTAYVKSIEGTILEKEVIKIISKNLKISQKKLKQLFDQAYKKHFKLNTQLIDFAIKLKKQGYKIAILSDQWHISKKSLVTSEIKKHFKPSVISCDVGIRKPDKKIYQLILKKLKLPAKSTLFIDNQEWNIKPAKKIGMNTILFKSNKQLINELRKLKII
jgi:epoxide hydrolase-like predicted phosphatase